MYGVRSTEYLSQGPQRRSEHRVRHQLRDRKSLESRLLLPTRKYAACSNLYRLYYAYYTSTQSTQYLVQCCSLLKRRSIDSLPQIASVLQGRWRRLRVLMVAGRRQTPLQTDRCTGQTNRRNKKRKKNLIHSGHAFREAEMELLDAKIVASFV
ncbi:hypothetical protein VFPPC_05654 [Pochonia chlamydosporia 170]|uniref:Uncharacterized protein n=1 Tax=Pochonia chlamydosporia 170 TaxID=1380566 RepID=A0A179FFJ4_METCM|nr:hypothetical protein VFPPC_05654 [Pochonia chlamydosporia 170]OAQ64375.1 hypothetical protein VFPPC_05654 [Pochonia chlamydosporia 170]